MLIVHSTDIFFHLIDKFYFTLRKKRIKSQSLFIIFQINSWPPTQRQVKIVTDVEEVCSFPRVIGFIDDSHIRLSAALGG